MRLAVGVGVLLGVGRTGVGLGPITVTLPMPVLAPQWKAPANEASIGKTPAVFGAEYCTLARPPYPTAAILVEPLKENFTVFESEQELGPKVADAEKGFPA